MDDEQGGRGGPDDGSGAGARRMPNRWASRRPEPEPDGEYGTEYETEYESRPDDGPGDDRDWTRQRDADTRQLPILPAPGARPEPRPQPRTDARPQPWPEAPRQPRPEARQQPRPGAGQPSGRPRAPQYPDSPRYSNGPQDPNPQPYPDAPARPQAPQRHLPAPAEAPWQPSGVPEHVTPSQAPAPAGAADRRWFRRPLVISAAAGVVIVLAAGGFVADRQLLGDDGGSTAARSPGSGSEVGGATGTGSRPDVGTPAVARLNVEATDGDIGFKIVRTRSGGTSLGAGADQLSANGRFLLVYVYVTNHGSQPAQLPPTEQRVSETGSGRAWAANPAAPLPSGKRLWGSIAPGATVGGVMAFDVPDGVKAGHVELHGTRQSAGVRLSL